MMQRLSANDLMSVESDFVTVCEPIRDEDNGNNSSCSSRLCTGDKLFNCSSMRSLSQNNKTKYVQPKKKRPELVPKFFVGNSDENVSSCDKYEQSKGSTRSMDDLRSSNNANASAHSLMSRMYLHEHKYETHEHVANELEPTIKDISKHTLEKSKHEFEFEKQLERNKSKCAEQANETIDTNCNVSIKIEPCSSIGLHKRSDNQRGLIEEELIRGNLNTYCNNKDYYETKSNNSSEDSDTSSVLKFEAPPITIQSSSDSACEQFDSWYSITASDSRLGQRSDQTNKETTFDDISSYTLGSFSQQQQQQGLTSLSDHSHNRCPAHHNRRQGGKLTRHIGIDQDYKAEHSRKKLFEQLKTLKESNKLITHVRKKSFSMHLECLDKLSTLSVKDQDATASSEYETTTSECRFVSETMQGQCQNCSSVTEKESDGTKQLDECADRLSYLYQTNKQAMDVSDEFRSLLYSIICCLLSQEDQVLSTPSVGKLLDVIRRHMNSAASFVKLSDLEQCNMKSIKRMRNNENDQSNETIKKNDEKLTSSVSFRDKKQSIEDFDTTPDCRKLMNNSRENISTKTASKHERSDSLSSSSKAGRNSPWNYESLAEECRQMSPIDQVQTLSSQLQHYTSQSSLDQATDTQDVTNDSGNGTMYEFRAESSSGGSCWASSNVHIDDIAKNHTPNKLVYCQLSADNLKLSCTCYSSSLATTDFHLNSLKPTYNDKTKQGSLMTSYDNDDYNTSSYHTLAKIGQSIKDQANYSSTNQKTNLQADTTNRRAELEWTLNRLINFELKQKWLNNNETLKRAIKRAGVPNEIRNKVWLTLMEQMIGDAYDATSLLEQAKKTIQMADNAEDLDANEQRSSEMIDDDTQTILKQIELDVNRTMPGHKLFDDGAEGGVKLRRILVAYSIHVNREIAYCQGFNFIVALLLSVFDGDEDLALRGFVCIVDHIFPSKYYFDHYLTGARADQFLLADFICDQLIKNPSLADRRMVEAVTSSITLNWFISLFHGAVPTLTRLIILDHFMLEGVKALFKFTMAILYLAFQVSPPSSCDVFAAIRDTARDMYDIKLLLSIVDQIRLPKDSYFAIRRSFYMVQSSLNSDQFYLQTLSNEASRNLCSSRPLNVQLGLDTKPPALSSFSFSEIGAGKLARLSARPKQQQLTPLDVNQAGGLRRLARGLANRNSNYATIGNSSFVTDGAIQRVSSAMSPLTRVQCSADRSKVCIQNLGKLGRSHLKIMDSNVRANERSFMSPLRNCLVIGLTNCGKHIVFVRQSSRKNFKSFCEQDFTFHIHELPNEIFDGFYLENLGISLILTHQGELFKMTTNLSHLNVNVSRQQTNCTDSNQDHLINETLLLRDSCTLIDDAEKIKLRQATIDRTTNLLWIYFDSEGQTKPDTFNVTNCKFKYNNPFCGPLHGHSKTDDYDGLNNFTSSMQQTNYLVPSKQRKILVIDVITFDIFSAFNIPANFGEITNLRASLVAYFQLSNQVSNQFSSCIVQIGPNGHYEQLLSFADVVDYIVSVPESFRTNEQQFNSKMYKSGQKYSSFRRLLTHSKSLHRFSEQPSNYAEQKKSDRDLNDETSQQNRGTLSRYYTNLIRTYSSAVEKNPNESSILIQRKDSIISKYIHDTALRRIISSSLAGNFSEISETNYIPVNMAFIFRNGKIALFEFTESYTIHSRESQLDRYDYSRVLDVIKNGDDFIVTILTVFDKLIKVII